MNNTTLLYRQIHPSFMKGTRLSSQAVQIPDSPAFKPTPKDQNRLSVYDGDLISPEDAFSHFTETLQLKSCGVLAVSVDECQHEELPVHSDPGPFSEHAVIDFTQFSDEKKRMENKAKKLRDYAVSRNWLYQNTSNQ